MTQKEPQVKISDPSEELNKRFSTLLYLVIGVMLIGFLSLLFMVVGIVIDSWRFSSSMYKESEQLRIQEENIKNTVDQQKIIIELLKNLK